MEGSHRRRGGARVSNLLELTPEMRATDSAAERRAIAEEQRLELVHHHVRHESSRVTIVAKGFLDACRQRILDRPRLVGKRK